MSGSLKREFIPENTELEYIGKSTSKFGKKAEEYLNIKINETDSFEDIINHAINEDKIEFSEDDIDDRIKELYLEDFDREKIRSFRPQEHKTLPEHAQTFLFKLSLVVNNNYQKIEPPHLEFYIHDLVEFLLKEAKFEQGTELLLMSCALNLYISDKSLAAQADKEGRRGTEIIWIIDEDKHKFDPRYKKGDIQLVANMIAASQTNRNLSDKNYPARMLGIKFDADRIYFYSSYISEEYLDCLLEDEPLKIQLIVNKFPKVKNELSLSIPEDRRKLLLYLSALRKYALSLTPHYE